KGNYCALSYCWGPKGGKSHMLTTTENVDHHLSNGMEVSRLPKTFQDAVVITRELGVRYLWIDALCIIQGDKADWAAESARMADVYGNAYLVIAASGAADPCEGSFSRRLPSPVAVEVPIRGDWRAISSCPP
ncbi:heterokaryon incompatibility protein-domain-containing protein, partial [Apodospora peruviana]